MTRLGLIGGITLGLCACNGTETGNPPAVLSGFDTSACKSESAVIKSSRAARADGGLGTTLDEARYQGLTCFVWSREDADTLRLQIVNHADSCGADQNWQPRAELKGHKLGLYLDNPSCRFARCLSGCTYDLSFEVHLDPMSTPLSVSLYGDFCEGAPKVTAEAVLPLGQSEHGEACTYLDANTLRFHGCKENAPGARFAPCYGTSGSSSGAANSEDCLTPGDLCGSSLSCGEVAPGDKRCLLSCSNDQECSVAAGTHCQDHVCVLPAK